MTIAEDMPPGLSALDRPNSYIGRSVPRPNLARLTQGRAQFVSDVVLPRMLYAKLLPITAMSTVSQSTMTSTRTPGNPYGIHVSACAQASSVTARKPGQTTGTSKDDGQSASARVNNASASDHCRWLSATRPST